MEGRARYALNLGGGLHHGFRGRASGFCVYNDSSVAIKYLQEKIWSTCALYRYGRTSWGWCSMEFL